jgi:hypothetical protein
MAMIILVTVYIVMIRNQHVGMLLLVDTHQDGISSCTKTVYIYIYIHTSHTRIYIYMYVCMYVCIYRTHAHIHAKQL